MIMKTELEWMPGASRILNKAQELQESVKDTAHQASRATTRYVEDHPWQVIAMVGLCAPALGFLLRFATED